MYDGHQGTDIAHGKILVGRDSPSLPTQVGGRWPAHASAIGKAILAFPGAGSVQAVFSGGLTRLRERTITPPRLFLQELDRVRESCVGYDFQRTRRDLVRMAGPVHASGGAVLASLSASGWSAGEGGPGRAGGAHRSTDHLPSAQHPDDPGR